MKITVGLCGLRVNGFEQQNFSREGHVNARHLPVLVSDIALANFNVTATIEMSENAPAETDVFLQRAIDHSDAIACRINQDVSLHAGQDLLNPRWRIIFRVRLKAKPAEFRSEEHTSE